MPTETRAYTFVLPVRSDIYKNRRKFTHNTVWSVLVVLLTGPVENTEEFRKVLLGGDHTNAKRDSIVLNAGVGCYVYRLSKTIAEGCKLARDTLYSGKATEKLEQWIKCSNEV